jgi:3-oxoacyl-[acyl-carrier-protein] synthase-3
MSSIEILGCGYYLPENIIDNKELNVKYNIDDNWIKDRTGINKRFYIKNENISDLAILSVKSLLNKKAFDIKKVGCIVVSTTSSDKLMPGISFEVQKAFDIPNCICMDILAGCSGYINAFDIVRKFIALNEIEYGIVIGVETLSKFLNFEDINTSILLGDGAGATLIGRTEVNKKYISNIVSDGKNGDILTCNSNEKIFMDGKSIYKLGIIKTVENIEELLSKSDESIENIKYIIPHQSNTRILESICERLNINVSKMYINIENIGNTFCASMPIALSELYDNKLINSGDKIILAGYGGGLNFGSILLEV